MTEQKQQIFAQMVDSGGLMWFDDTLGRCKVKLDDVWIYIYMMIYTIIDILYDDTLTSQRKECMSMSIDRVLKKFSATEFEIYLTNDHCYYSSPSPSLPD